MSKYKYPRLSAVLAYLCSLACAAIVASVLVSCTSNIPQGAAPQKQEKLYQITHFSPNGEPKVFETTDVDCYQAGRVNFKATDGFGYILYGDIEIKQLK